MMMMMKFSIRFLGHSADTLPVHALAANNPPLKPPRALWNARAYSWQLPVSCFALWRWKSSFYKLRVVGRAAIWWTLKCKNDGLVAGKRAFCPAMSKNRRKVTVEGEKSSDEEGGSKRSKPSVFERLGPGATSSRKSFEGEVRKVNLFICGNTVK